MHSPVMYLISRSFCLSTSRWRGHRISYRLHVTHFELWSLASGPHRERYEELRAAYNGVRPKGSLPAPPYEKVAGMSDICDHPDSFCRYDAESPAYADPDRCTPARFSFCAAGVGWLKRARIGRISFLCHLRRWRQSEWFGVLAPLWWPLYLAPTSWSGLLHV